MCLRNINSIEAARAFLPSFILKWNEKFSVKPRDAVLAHRRWTKTEAALEIALARQEERVLSKALTFSYGGTKYRANTHRPGAAMRGAEVLLRRLADGRATARCVESSAAMSAVFRHVPRHGGHCGRACKPLQSDP
jgi:hypothetical protein